MLTHYGLRGRALVEFPDESVYKSRAGVTSNPKELAVVHVGKRGTPAVIEGTLYHELGHVVDARRNPKVFDEETTVYGVSNPYKKSYLKYQTEKRANEFAKPFVDKMTPDKRKVAKWGLRASLNTYTHFYEEKKDETGATHLKFSGEHVAKRYRKYERKP
jgi:hypothetical protein